MRDSTGLHETPVGNRNYGYGMLTRTYAEDCTTPETGCIFDYDTPNTTSQVTYKLLEYTVMVLEQTYLQLTE